jgi:hypothetical protein
MKRYFLIIGLFLWLFLGLCNVSNAWENKFTHPAITEQAVNSSAAQINDYLKNQLGLSDGLSTQLYWNFPSDIETRMTRNGIVDPIRTKTILNWLRAGSAIEDEDGRWKPWRPRHHFHDPIRNAGLDNHFDYPNWEALDGWLPLGESALWWAIKGYDRGGRIPTYNENYWWSAREDFRRSLVLDSKSLREANLASAFVNLGCVLHLLEDMGVPTHARNDFLYGHFRSYLFNWGNLFESWAEEQVISNGGRIPGTMLTDWTSQPRVFSKLADYWDSGVEPTQPSMVSPSADWGLSECTNYQFLSDSTIFKADVNNTRYYFPNPDYNHTSRYTQGAGKNKGIYLRGYDVEHLARWKFTSKFGDRGTNYRVSGDPKIYEDYAKITIPRTIDYAAGLVNYFFRGKIEASATDYDGYILEITIKNLSKNSDVEQVLKGGTFELYWDDQDGIRSPVGGTVTVHDPTGGDWGSNSVLAYNRTTTIEFTPVTPPEGKYLDKYVVVYKGGIQSDAGHPDSDDNQALATASFYCGGELGISIWYDGPECGQGPGYVYQIIDIWNASTKSGVPQDLVDGTFEIYYEDLQGQLILFTSVTGYLDYMEDVLEINTGVMEQIPAQDLIVIYKGKMADSENPEDEYDGVAVGSTWIGGIGSSYCDSELCGCIGSPW